MVLIFTLTNVLINKSIQDKTVQVQFDLVESAVFNQLNLLSCSTACLAIDN